MDNRGMIYLGGHGRELGAAKVEEEAAPASGTRDIKRRRNCGSVGFMSSVVLVGGREKKLGAKERGVGEGGG